MPFINELHFFYEREDIPFLREKKHFFKDQN